MEGSNSNTPTISIPPEVQDTQKSQDVPNVQVSDTQQNLTNEPEQASSSVQQECTNVEGDVEICSEFPDIVNTTWKRADDGKESKCSIQFLSNGTLKVNKKLQKKSSWKLSEDKKILETHFHGRDRELKFLFEEKKAVVIDSGSSSSSAMWKTLITLSDYENKGKELAERYCSTQQASSIMIPPAPQHTYKDSYPENAASQDPRIEDNLQHQADYEAEVLVYRALERLKEDLIVLHGFKCSNHQRKLCDRNFKIPKGGAGNSTECDFLIIGRNFFVVIEVKNSTTGGNPCEAFQKSLEQRNRVKELIMSICPVAIVLSFTAFPSLDSESFDDFVNLQERFSEMDRSSVILKKDLREFSTWWQHGVSSNIPLNSSIEPYHEKVKHILLAISCTELDVPDECTFNLGATVMRIDHELKAGEITLEQHFKNTEGKVSINPGVVVAPEEIREFVGVQYLTREQKELFDNNNQSIWINGPAGSGKTVILAGKMVQQAVSGKKVVVVKFAGPNNNSKVYETTCENAGVTFDPISTGKDKHTPSQLFDLITQSNNTVVILNIRVRDIKWLTDTLALLSNCSSYVIIDDIQCMFIPLFNPADYDTFLDTLINLSVEITVLIACDLVQGMMLFIVDRLIGGLNWLPDLLVSKLSADQFVTLTSNLRNTRDVSDIVSVIRNQIIDYWLNRYDDIVRYILPWQHSGHFIRGVVVDFHIFDRHSSKNICNIFEKELFKLRMCNKMHDCHSAVILDDYNLLKLIKDTPDINLSNITVCHCFDCYSSEWPAVIVLHKLALNEQYNLSKLYVMVSRARVKCSVFLNPERRKILSDISYMLHLLDKLEPLANVIRH